ncbi:exonuclease SbcCD subunit D C-terminal domain-containing protein [Aeromonas veronii]|uniref:Nuclease SbcCD subunit D n=1 Tax=Aeromonas veronii TaxID=654 RepID=A0A2S3XIG2_AERVE|nr:exonuclease SbcCD subunit D C-terminal domain-containing protein [Aeromonas veronii]AMQ43943.1 metallophosphatase [Aeromonas veronii]MCX0427056.1 exonuclease SbcCD subunit D C-terminal domain-containing protein [Aeromonas veronii]MCX0448494.1 exonuclease SbcCD subunit D C-terminal domain-containing protein [Aeromonas veronii]POG17658.1 exonuclease sbcCD subunit D [Aeromonas veronii]PTH79805.1 exonuclease sbcCD subunit D [Aeromonas veronii]
MKILHTADWHLGHQLHGHDRRFEHDAFLDWLSDTLKAREIDALLVAGDLFDTANPPASAWQQLYRFLARLRAEMPHLNMVLIGGNHDSPSKLDAPHELLRAFDLHLVGSISRDSEGKLETDRLLVPLQDKEGKIAAWCAAVPFLRSSDLRVEQLAEGQDRLIEGVRQVYAEVLAEGRARCGESLPLIAMGHAYLAAGQLSELSERRVLGGNQHALPAELFAGADYTALGHLHLAQSPAEGVHYSGSPLPLSLTEANYNHQVLEVTFAEGKLTGLERIPVPRAVEMIRLPQSTLDDALKAIASLELPACPQEAQPFLEVRLQLPKPEARIRERILAAIADKPVRLARITTSYQGSGEGLADGRERRRLDELSPTEVFRLCYQRQFEGEPEAQLVASFEEILEQVKESNQ